MGKEFKEWASRSGRDPLLGTVFHPEGIASVCLLVLSPFRCLIFSAYLSLLSEAALGKVFIVTFGIKGLERKEAEAIG